MTNEIHIQVNVSPLLYISYRFFFHISYTIISLKQYLHWKLPTLSLYKALPKCVTNKTTPEIKRICK